MKEISSDFQKKDLEYTDANDLWEEFADRLHTAVNAHIPSKIVSKRNSTPWISHTIKRLHKRKQRACNKARKSGTQEDWDKFRELRKLVKKESRKAYRRYVIEKCLESVKQFCENTQKRLHWFSST